MMSDKEIEMTRLATIYKVRLTFAGSEKNEYTREEIVELLDKIAIANKE